MKHMEVAQILPIKEKVKISVLIQELHTFIFLGPQIAVKNQLSTTFGNMLIATV